MKESFSARLTIDPLSVQEGGFVVIDSGGYRFYGLVTDLKLGATDPRFADEQSATVQSSKWKGTAMQESISLLQSYYSTSMIVLGALRD